MFRSSLADGRAAPEICLRIPGAWVDHEALADALPPGHALRPGRLDLPDGSCVELHPLPADRAFPVVFDTACRFGLPPRSRRAVRRAAWHVGVIGEGGSVPAARRMLHVAAALVRAGGAGAFIDNGIIAHTGADVLAFADHDDLDALVLTYANVVRAPEEIRTFGMHALGRPDVEIPCDPDHEDDLLAFAVLGFLRETCRRGGPLSPGARCTSSGMPLRTTRHLADGHPRESPIHNPFGRWCLETEGS